MGKLKKIFLTLLVIGTAACAGAGIAACGNGNTPTIIPPDDIIDTGEFKGSYSVKIQSQGGLPLNGVKVTVEKDGENKGEFISSDGKITFTLTPDEYELVVDESTLPLGYFVPSGTTYKTSDSQGDAVVSLHSSVIDGTAPSGTSYTVGDIMYDFTFEDIDGIEHNLADTLANKKMVMLNFWGPACQPCRIEFPAIQSAYSKHKENVEIFALASYSSPTLEQVIKFRDDYPEYTFIMGMDNVPGTYIYNLFGVMAYPTTVIIDRYGAIAEVTTASNSSEASWNALFTKYISDDYTQEPIDPIDKEKFEWQVPQGTMPASQEIEAAVNSSTAAGKITYSGETDDELSWPFVLKEVDGEKVLAANNISTDQSYAIIHCEVQLKAGDGLSYEYYIDTKSEYNLLYVILNGDLYDKQTGTSTGWTTKKIYVAKRTVTLDLAFCFYKSDVVDVDTPCYLKNFNIYDASQDGETVDLAYSVSDGATLSGSGKYDVNVFEKDGLYYCTYTDNNGKEKTSILYADLLEVTDWTEKHFGALTFEFESENVVSSYTASLYYISFFKMRDTVKDQLYYDEENYIYANYYIQLFSPCGFTPVTPKLKYYINAFLDEAHESGIAKGDRYEDEWLEFCYYFMHWGEEHKDGLCWMYTNPVQGATFEFANEVIEYDENNPEDTLNFVNITLGINLAFDELEAGGGQKYIFVPKESGVYLFESITDGDASADADPRIDIYNSAKKSIASQDDDLRYNHFEREDGNNFYLYVVLEAGQTYYLTLTMNQAGATGTYKFKAQYVGGSAELFRVCTTGDGTWRPAVNEDGSLDYNKTYYNAIDVIYDEFTDCYYALKNNGNGSKVYVDFVRDTYYALGVSGKVVYPSLYEMTSKYKLFSNVNGHDYTEQMLAYYEKAVSGDEDDELYGFVEADAELVDILNDYMNKIYGDSPSAGAWLMFACYYETYGTPAN